jgi:polyisoprenoid-binding protein YceI
MMSKVRGEMKVKEGWIQTEGEDLGKARVEVVIDANSVDTGVEQRDNHLRSPDGHFDVANYPTITFKSKRVEGKDRSDFKVIGDLTIHGHTKEVVLNASFSGQGQDPWGNQRVGFSAETKLNRKDYDLTWNQALEAGGFLLGDDVKVEIDVEAVETKTETAAKADIAAVAAAESR